MQEFSCHATTIDGEDHHPNTIFSQFSLPIGPKTGLIALVALKIIANTFKEVLGPQYAHIVANLRVYIGVLSMVDGPEAAEGPVQALSEEADGNLGPDAAQSVDVLVELAQNLHDREHFQDAQTEGERTSKRTRTTYDSRRIASIRE